MRETERTTFIRSAGILAGAIVILTGCGSESRQPAQRAGSDREWYSGGHLSLARMSEWMEASDRDRLATSADIAAKALEVKFGSLEAGMRKLGSMDDLRPYATEVQACITAAGEQPDTVTPRRWKKVLTTQRVSEIGVACAVTLKLPD